MNDSRSSIVLPVIVGAIVAAAGPILWIGAFKINAVWLAAIGIGVLIGLAMRLIGKSADHRLQAIGAILAAASCVGGYLVTDLYVIPWVDPTGQPVQPGIGDALQRFVSDLVSIVLIAVGAYLAYTLARRSFNATTPE